MNKVALFDFCETLVNFQTADAYVDFVREKLQVKRMNRLERIQNCSFSRRIIWVAERITGYHYSLNKRLKLLQLRGLSCDILQKLAKDYYYSVIKHNFIPELIDRMIELRNNGFDIYMVSGGYDVYLRYFVEEYCLTGLISTRIGFYNKKCTGKFDGIDCLREGKIILLDKCFKTRPAFSMAFSDSVSDLPFLRWADEGYVVSRNIPQEWAKENKLKEILWIEGH